MKQTLKHLLTVMALVLALAAVFSCGKKSASEPEGSAEPDMEALPEPEPELEPSISRMEVSESGMISVTAGEKAPAIMNVLTMDYVEHKLPKLWRNYQIEVAGQRDKKSFEPDIKLIYDAIVDVFPLPMLVQWAWAGVDSPGVWEKESRTVLDKDNFYLAGEWIDPAGNYNDHFELKAWQVNAGTWTVGLNYQPLWDGDQGIGVYGLQMYWWYAPNGDATLYPRANDEDSPQPLKDDYDIHFDRETNTVVYPDAPDPAAEALHWNGFWFEQW
jgi:hypothetical protein